MSDFYGLLILGVPVNGEARECLVSMLDKVEDEMQQQQLEQQKEADTPPFWTDTPPLVSKRVKKTSKRKENKKLFKEDMPPMMNELAFGSPDNLEQTIEYQQQIATEECNETYVIASSSNVDDVVVDEKSNTKQVNIKEFEKNGFYTNPVANVNDAMAAAAEATTATSTTSTSSDGLASVSSASFVDQTMEEEEKRQNSLHGDIAVLNREIRYETRSKLKRKRSNDDHDQEQEQDENNNNGCVADLIENREMIVQQEEQPQQQDQKQQHEVDMPKMSKRVKKTSKREENKENSEQVKKESEVTVFLAERQAAREVTLRAPLAQLSSNHKIVFNKNSSSNIAHEYVLPSQQIEPPKKQLKTETKYDEMTLTLTCENDDDYDLNSICNGGSVTHVAHGSSSSSSLLLAFAPSNTSTAIVDRQNNLGRLNDFVTNIHNQQHSQMHMQQFQAFTNNDFIFGGSPLADLTNNNMYNINQATSGDLVQQTFKRKLGSEDEFVDELGFHCQMSRDYTTQLRVDTTFELEQHSARASNIDFNNNASVGGGKKPSGEKEKEQAEEEEDEEDEFDEEEAEVESKATAVAQLQRVNNGNNGGFLTEIVYNGVNLLDIEKDKQPAELDFIRYTLRVIKAVFDLNELYHGIIVMQGQKNRSVTKRPLDLERIQIVKETVRNKLRYTKEFMEVQWNANRSKLNSRFPKPKAV